MSSMSECVFICDGAVSFDCLLHQEKVILVVALAKYIAPETVSVPVLMRIAS